MTKPTTNAGQFKLWNVPQTDPFVGQPAFVVRTGPRDAIYADFVSAKGSTAGRSFVMTDEHNTPLYAG